MQRAMTGALTAADHGMVVLAVRENWRFLHTRADLVGYTVLGLSPEPRFLLELLRRAPGLDDVTRARVDVVLGEIEAFQSALRGRSWTEAERTLLTDVRVAMAMSPRMDSKLRALKDLRTFYRFLAFEVAGARGCAEAVGYAVDVLESGAGTLYIPADGETARPRHAGPKGGPGSTDPTNGATDDAVAVTAGGIIGGPDGAIIGGILHSSLRILQTAARPLVAR